MPIRNQSGIAAQRSFEIASIQCRLTLAGYDPGPIDGLYGAKTKRAAHQFSRDRGKIPEHPVILTQQEAQRAADRMMQNLGRASDPVSGGLEVPWTLWLTNALIDHTEGQLYRCQDALERVYHQSGSP